MHKEIKKNIIEILDTVFEAHNVLKKSFDDQNYQEVNNLLADCQETVINVGGYIEKSEGEDCDSILLLNEYCKTLYDVSGDISNLSDGVYLKDILDKSLLNAKNSIEDIKVKYEIVFMPYKASMWDSLESVWEAAKNDPECDVYVVPIPYYDRNPDHSFGDFHYEGNEFPDYVPITSYVAYDLSKRKPDVIYIHNPYDDCNFVTSVAPRFYSKELKRHTSMLVYVPYFILEEPDVDNISLINHFVVVSAIENSDRVVVQSQAMRYAYIRELLSVYGDTDENRKKFSEKVVGLGSPKCDKVICANKSNYDISEEWRNIIGDKKVVFFNTSITNALTTSEAFLDKLESVIEYFTDNDKYILWWRPHPLLRSTFMSMRNTLLQRYNNICDEFKNNQKGIYDETSDFYCGIVHSDIYYGDKNSSIPSLYSYTRKPIIFSETDADVETDMKVYISGKYSNVMRIDENQNGTSGAKIHLHIKNELHSKIFGDS